MSTITRKSPKTKEEVIDRLEAEVKCIESLSDDDKAIYETSEDFYQGTVNGIEYALELLARIEEPFGHEERESNYAEEMHNIQRERSEFRKRERELIEALDEAHRAVNRANNDRKFAVMN